MKRSKPLRRNTPLRARSKTKKYRRRERDIDYMLDVTRLPCAVRMAYAMVAFGDASLMPKRTRCYGRVEADHAGKHGLGEKSDDNTVIPMCTKHHEEKTNLHGAFYGWTGERIRRWLDIVIEITRHEIEKLRAIRQRYA